MKSTVLDGYSVPAPPVKRNAYLFAAIDDRIAKLEDACKISPNDTFLLFELGRHLVVRWERTLEAEDVFNRLIALDPETYASRVKMIREAARPEEQADYSS